MKMKKNASLSSPTFFPFSFFLFLFLSLPFLVISVLK